MKRWVLLFAFFITVLQNNSQVAYAENEFTSSYNVVYAIKDTGTARVTQNIFITNTTSDYYVNEYSLTISSTKINNIYASDSEGPLKIDVSKNNNGTEIKTTFNKKVAGLGKTLNFTLSYDSEDIASHNGNIWEVNIPKLAKTEGTISYVATLLVPSSFGNPTYIHPNPGSKALIFTKEQLEKTGITITFGEYQLLNYTLKYYLSNPKKNKIYIEIALPPETKYQQIWLEAISPQPNSVKIDEDGNWLARYNLNVNQSINIIATGSAKLHMYPLGSDTLSEIDRQKYLEPKKYWEVNDPKISELAKNLQTPKAIYDYVVKTLSYDYKRVNSETERFGAVQALNKPTNAVCMEFTDLFIALSRAAGIPARELNGYAYTNNEKLRPLSLSTDILHAWPEYWDSEKNVWIPVDPTWENTTSGVDYFNKLDFNHFVFAIKGMDSEYPFPAGSYKKSINDKDVLVTFTDKEPLKEDKSDIIFNIPDKVYAGFSFSGNIQIINNGKTLLTNKKIYVTSDPLSLNKNGIANISKLAPLGTYEIPITIENTSFLLSKRNRIVVSMDLKKAQKDVLIVPIFSNTLLVGLGLIGGSMGLLFVYVGVKWIRKK